MLTVPSNGTTPIFTSDGSVIVSGIRILTSVCAAERSATMRLDEDGLDQSVVQELDSVAPQFMEPVTSSTSATSSRLEDDTTSDTMSMPSDVSPPEAPRVKRPSGRNIVCMVAFTLTRKPLSSFATA